MVFVPTRAGGNASPTFTGTPADSERIYCRIGNYGERMGNPIQVTNGKFIIPNDPIIPFIEGDGVGRDIWRASQMDFDSAVNTAYSGEPQIAWREVLAGEKAFNQTGSWLPEETLNVIREHHIAIKGPLTTPVGGGIRSLNVALRQILDLYVCMRPVRYFNGVPSPMKRPDKLNV